MATPFHANTRETLDLISFTRAITFMKEVGVNGVTIAGVLGESNRIIDTELVRFYWLFTQLCPVD
jgi:dihydrodipicolinate synthase/N-acetylneuraminate lyase